VNLDAETGKLNHQQKAVMMQTPKMMMDVAIVAKSKMDILVTRINSHHFATSSMHVTHSNLVDKILNAHLYDQANTPVHAHHDILEILQCDVQTSTNVNPSTSVDKILCAQI